MTPTPAIELIPHVFPDPGWTRRVQAEIPWKQQTIRMFGRTVDMPRLTCWLGDPGATYTYSGLRNEPEPWTPSLTAIRRRVEDAAGVDFDSVLANLYRDGRDHMGWHSDDEPELGPEPVIASVSFGATRTFRFRHRYDREVEPVSVELPHGSLLLMRGRSQADWQHCLPKRLRVRDIRINLTFRRVLR